MKRFRNREAEASLKEYVKLESAAILGGGPNGFRNS